MAGRGVIRRRPSDPRILPYLVPAAIMLLKRQREGPPPEPVSLSEARVSFRAFLTWWRFKIREGGGHRYLGTELWPSQDQVVTLLTVLGVLRLCVLKAGKLGITEVLIAFAAFRGLFGPVGARVHLFSTTKPEAQALLELIRTGVRGLPPEWGFRISNESRGGDTWSSLKVLTPDGDVREFVAYEAKATASIAESCVHAHIDELAHMTWGRGLYNSVITTVPDDGTVAVLSRGAGDGNQMADLWTNLVPSGVTYEHAHQAALDAVAAGDTTRMVPVFQPFDMRPGRDSEWRARQGATMTAAGLGHYAPESPDDALADDAEDVFVEAAQWDALPSCEPLGERELTERTPLVLALDAGVRNDSFALTAGRRQYDNRDEVAVCHAKEWKAPVDLTEVEVYIHSLAVRHDEPPARDHDWQHCTGPEGFNIINVAFDPYQLEEMAQRFEGRLWFDPFEQGAPRAKGDKAFRDAITQRRLQVVRDPALRDHVTNAGIKTYRDEDALRIVKRVAGKKIDLAVAAAMVTARCKALNL